jgi:diphosphomevalonate decarboxylase
MHEIRLAHGNGLAACTTVDAGPNVHVICENGSSAQVERLLTGIPGVREVRTAQVGGPARIVESN